VARATVTELIIRI